MRVETPRRARTWALALATSAGALGLLGSPAGATASVSSYPRPLVRSDSSPQVHLALVQSAPLRTLAVGGTARRRRAQSAPNVTGQPTGVVVAPGTFARFSASASGTPRPRAHWQISVNGGQSWRNIAGARGTRLSFMALAGQNGDQFRAVFVNRRGSTRTSAALLHVTVGNSAPLIETQPASTTVADGASATFTALAAGTPMPNVQWEISVNGGASWSEIAGATKTTLAFTASSILSGDEFRAAFANPLGSALSATATLTVSGSLAAGPTITQQPQDESVAAGQTASFTAGAAGTPAPSVQWQISTNAGASWSNIPGASATTYSFAASAAQNLYEYQAVFTSSAGTVASEPAVLAVGYGLGENWSGYLAVGTSYSGVSGSWRVPTVTCPVGSADTYSSQWVGIDGVDDSTVEQDGTSADCDGTLPSYSAWYEMYGDSAVNGGAPVTIPRTVAPGDLITATVSVSSGVWTLTVSDTTNGWTYPVTPINWSAPEQSSAEWIVERPSLCDQSSCQISSLADFGTVTFTGAQATTTSGTQSTIGALGGQALEMIRSGTNSTLLATPGALDPTGQIFTDTWYAND